MYDHVILISLDTLRSDCIAANPYKLWPYTHPSGRQPRTGVLDYTAGEGAFFSTCISAAPYTSASHASFFTGMWPLKHGVFEFFNRKLTAPTLFTLARRNGYRTVFKTDFPIILGPFLGFERDIDNYVVEDDEEFLSSLKSTERSFNFVHFGGIHIPYGFHNLRYGGDAYRRKVAEMEEEIPRQEGFLADSLVESYRDDEDMELLLRYKRCVQYHYAHGNYDKLFSMYLDGVSHFCETRFGLFFERLIGLLKGRRFLLVIFGDHGEEYDADSYGHHNSLSEGVLRVPVIFYGTDIPPSHHHARIRSVDVAPTVVDLLGLPASQRRDMDGVSLADTILHGAAYPERSAFAQAYTNDTREFVDFQKRLLASGRKTGALRHVLYKEAFYEGDFKVTRQSYHYAEHGGISQLRPCPQRITLERRDASARWHAGADAATQTRMLAELDAYNLTRKGGAADREVPDHIRQQLINMGYRV